MDNSLDPLEHFHVLSLVLGVLVFVFLAAPNIQAPVFLLFLQNKPAQNLVA